MAISEKLVKINNEIIAQEDLLVQILASLQNKSAPNLPTRETWVFALADGSTIEKEVYIDLPKGNIIKVSDSSGVVLWENLDYVEIGTLSVGSKISLNVNGTARNFIIVQQGNPDTALYDSSCDGTWLLMEDLYTLMKFDTDSAVYQTSDVHIYLNSDFIALLDSDVADAIKTVKIPYVDASTSDNTYYTGTNGLSTQVFLVSNEEVNCGHGNGNTPIGCVLEYFVDTENAVRIAYFEGTARPWHTRECKYQTGSYQYASGVKADGGVYGYNQIGVATIGVRPAFILPSNMRIAKDSVISI